MNAREAKRRACEIAGKELHGALGAGFESLEEDDNGNPLSDADAERMQVAMMEIVEELMRRGGYGRRAFFR